MKITKPSYFDTFRCIADRCPDSCCKEWDVQVDRAAAAFYRSLQSPLGDRLREVLVDEDAETVMTIVNRRCPMWRDDGLCEIQAQLGHEALCKTCREFPRLTHDYGDFIEFGLELSCPEAARIILISPAETLTAEVSGGEEPEYDTEAMEVLLRTRETAQKILADTSRPVGEALALLLMYGYQTQSELDGAEESPFDSAAALAEARNFARPGNSQTMLDFFGELEILTEDWENLLHSPAPDTWNEAHLRLARYFVDRYWLQAVSDYDLVCRVKLAVISCLVIKHLGGDIFRTSQLYSKEIENDIDNIEAILDGAYESPAFTDDKLLGLLLT
ncbi:MAG: flagellin lysine-N-methylase [Oscillospiraceae bacterium]|nr:flagellin lysine-N-methylase [Oscillospiraceae bacterium]